MKTLKQLLFLSLTAVLAVSCDDGAEAPPVSVETVTVSDLNAVSGTRFTFFNLRSNSVVTDSASMNWDIGMRALSGGQPYIIFNGAPSGPGAGGAQIVEGILEEYNEAPATGYSAAMISDGWYTYTGTTRPARAVLVQPGKLFIIRTADGKYAKLQFLSLYQGNPDTSTDTFANLATRPAFGYFTFRYAIQSNGSRRF
jgi:hypothetical protein